MEIRDGVSYDDVLVVPQRSPVESRDDVDLSTRLAAGLELDRPILSAPMDSVTEAETAVALSRAGGLGTIHRFVPIAAQADEVRSVVETGERVGAAVGIDEDFVERARACLDAGADCVMVDVAHGHLERTLDAVADLAAAFPDAPLVAGNVVTKAAVADLAAAGADCVKVGVGPGSHCTTREVTGAGMPQLTAVDDCADAAAAHGVTTIADGGIRSSGDAVKALLAGADAVMLGGFFAGTAEAPGETVTVDGERFKRSRGMASAAANDRRSDKDVDVTAEEGVAALTPYRGPLADAVEEFAAGIHSGLSYAGGHTVEEARKNATFVRASDGAKGRQGVHGVAVEDVWAADPLAADD